MTQGATGPGHSRLAYPGTVAMLVLAFAFPIGLMVFNPTLMFERGWEQFVGTGIYLWAVCTLGRELHRIWKNEQAFDDAPRLLKQFQASKGAVAVSEDDDRVLPRRFRQLAATHSEATAPSVSHVMELNREGSALDQEHAAGRFTLTRYILYLLPVIGFIGTVEGISKALMNISVVLPEVKDLDKFLQNLTGVTSALQIAFDSTLLALFLSAALMLVQTLVFRRSEDLLARVDRWIVEHVLPKLGTAETSAVAGLAQVVVPQMEQLRREIAALIEPAARSFELQAERWSAGLGMQIDRFSESVDHLPTALAGFQRGAEAMGRLGHDLEALGAAGESLRRGVASIARIEAAVTQPSDSDQQLAAIQQGLDRTCRAIETLSGSWTQAYERSSRATQEHLARTLGSLKDALDMLNVSMEQSNALYRSIVKKMIPTYPTISADDQAA
ncbi:MAG: MotA/TolQ/ExbB proton channel family protein [Isosphaeraceae bacterium]|nr:MotA/TolQ/ExbB proton channel family protein [Isosphaeraceae bacterium]